MTGAAEQVAANIASTQPVLAMFQSCMALGSYLCPTISTIDEINSTQYFDYVIAGGGTAGSIMAYRLSECPGVSVLLLEEGGCPPIESFAAGLFPLTPRSYLDRAINSTDDDYTSQNQQRDAGITVGRLLGGSASIDHMIRVWPVAKDLEHLCAAANDSSWCGEDMFQYFRKSEKVDDAEVLSQNIRQYGTDGELLCTRQQSSKNDFMKEAFIEMGYPFLPDTDGQCAVEPLLTIGDHLRTNGNAFLSKMFGRSNLKVLTGARVEKILFNGTTATGLQYDYDGTLYTVTANKKVVVCLGTIISPQLLMLSGVGNRTALAEKGINSVVDNPEVGKNLQDHAASLIPIALDYNTSTVQSVDPFMWPAPMTLWFLAANESETTPEMTTINVLADRNSTGLLQLCMNVFKYKSEICNEIAKYNEGRNFLMMVLNFLHPESKGIITLNTDKITDQPNVYYGMFSNGTDLDQFSYLAQKASGILNTTIFQNRGAELVDCGLCSEYPKYSYEFWKCHVLAFSSPGWHYIGTCGLGKVVDASFHVIGTENLMIVDASVISYLPSAKLSSSVTAVAEKAADVLKAEDNLSCSA